MLAKATFRDQYLKINYVLICLVFAYTVTIAKIRAKTFIRWLIHRFLGIHFSIFTTLEVILC